MTYTMVILVYAGILAKGDSVSLFTIPGWNTKSSCEYAAKKLPELVSGTTKSLRTICLEFPAAEGKETWACPAGFSGSCKLAKP